MNYIKELKITDWVSIILAPIMFLTIYLVFIEGMSVELVLIHWLRVFAFALMGISAYKFFSRPLREKIDFIDWVLSPLFNFLDRLNTK